RLTHSIASSSDLTCQSQKPAINSFVSAKGPSMTVRLLPENRTRLPRELGWSPSPASITPAFTSSSLNFPISVSSCSLAITPASSSWFALIRTMTRIAMSPLGYGVGPGPQDGLDRLNLGPTISSNERQRDRQVLLLFFEVFVSAGNALT